MLPLLLSPQAAYTCTNRQDSISFAYFACYTTPATGLNSPSLPPQGAGMEVQGRVVASHLQEYHHVGIFYAAVKK